MSLLIKIYSYHLVKNNKSDIIVANSITLEATL